jgi:Flp pilus assembly protein TadG
VGFLYSAKAKLQAAVDGASLAAARSLNVGLTLSAQQASAAQNAVNWFYGNFPPGTWGATNIQMDNTASHVHVYTDATNAQLDHVDVTATASVPTYFMKWFGAPATTVTAIGNATRRAVVVMMVLDRSGSMCTPASMPCAGTGNTLPCSKMVTAAKQFTGQFAEGRDYIGLVSYSENVYIHTAPTTSFQSTLGYSNNSGSGTGAIDGLSCDGFTNTAGAVAAAYQLLVQTGLPGALNIILLETDGLPNTVAMNFWDSTHTISGLSAISTCKDKNNKTKALGGFTNSASLPSWTPGLTVTAAPFLTTSGYYSNIPAGIVGVVGATDPGEGNYFDLMLNYWTTAASNTGAQSQGNAADPYNAFVNLPAAATPGCGFNGSPFTTTPSDLSWFPAADVWGNQLNPSYGGGATTYQSVTTDAQGHVAQSGWANFHAAALNTADNAAYIARANTTLPAYVFAIGLGGNSAGGPPDPILLQRMANDPNRDEFNASPLYPACAQEVGCSTWAGQYQGKFIYAPTTDELNQAFALIASQILRLSK